MIHYVSGNSIGKGKGLTMRHHLSEKLIPSVVAELLKDGHQPLVFPDEVYAWLVFDGDCVDWCDGYPDKLDQAEWLRETVDSIGLAHAVFGDDAWDSTHSAATACMAHGIAPDQLFLVRFYGYWYRFDDYSREGDSGSSCDVLLVEPVAEAEAASRWQKWIEAGQ